MDLQHYNSYIEVDTDALLHNINIIRNHIGGEHDFIPVVKANGYGAGDVDIARFLTCEAGCRTVAVAQVLEGVRLREGGITDADILILGGAPAHVYDTAVKYRLQMTVFSIDGARLLNECARSRNIKAQCHIKIETGMNRIGVKPGASLAALAEYIKTLEHLEVVGVFTHFATAGKPHNPFTFEQYSLFKQALAQLSDMGITPRYVHCCNTTATQWLPEAHHTHVRVGSLFMGYSDLDDGDNPLAVKESLSWRAFVTNVHELQAGESCGYSRFFMADKPTMVATVDFGYADGFFRPLAVQGAPIFVNESRTKYLGICMDQCFVDVSGIDCKIGDEVTIFGYTKGGQHLSPYEFEKLGQTYVSCICAPNHRVLRIFK